MTYTVYVALDTIPPDTTLAPGMTATAAITTAQHSDVLVVPSRSIRRQGARQVVDVWVNGHTETRQVSTGLSANNLTEVTSGLNEGDLVVLPAATPTTTTTTPTRGFGGGLFAGPGGGR